MQQESKWHDLSRLNIHEITEMIILTTPKINEARKEREREGEGERKTYEED